MGRSKALVQFSTWPLHYRRERHMEHVRSFLFRSPRPFPFSIKVWRPRNMGTSSLSNATSLGTRRNIMEWPIWNHKVQIDPESSISDKVVRWLNETIGVEGRDWSLQCAYLKRRPVVMLRTEHQADMFRRRWAAICV